MENEFETKTGTGNLEQKIQYFFQRRCGIKVQRLRSVVEAIRIQEPRQSVVMVSMKVGDENMVNLALPDFVSLHLCLGGLATVYQQQLVIGGHYLRGLVPVVHGQG
jgi:hypothetical protein